MELFRPLVFDLLKLLEDTFKIYLKNGRLMAFIAALIISLHTMLFLFNHFSLIKPLITDLAARKSYLTPATMLKDVKIYVAVEWVYFLISTIASLLLTVSTIHASALIHGGKTISNRDLVLRTVRSFKRPFVTCFYVTLFNLGYMFFSLATLLPFVLILASQVNRSLLAILLTIIYVVFYAYLSVVWNVSIVVSVLEEKFGIEALGKAAQIVKGLKLQGFILKLLFDILHVILFHYFRLMIKSKHSEAIRIVISLLLLNSMWMVGMLGITAFTVFYYQCKKTHGEEIELQADHMEYTKIPTAPLINENIP